MTKISNSSNSNAREIAQALDKYDGKDGKITSNTWNNVFKAKEKGGNEIRSHISVQNAEKSIRVYLQRNEKSSHGQKDLGQKWFDELDAKALNDIKEKDQAAKAVSTDDTVMEGAIQEVVITSNKKLSEVVAHIDVPAVELKLPKLEELPVSTFVAGKPEVEAAMEDDRADLAATLKRVSGILDISQYVEMAKVNKTSTAKSSDVPINADILDRAFDNVIKALMQRGGKTKSVLIGAARDFLAAAKEHNVDPFMLMGISMIESAYGTSKMAISKNNVCGLTPNGKDGIHCATVADSISKGAKTLHNNVYKKGLESIGSIGTKGNYCCGTSAQRASWANAVTSFANQVREEYNKILTEEKRIALNTMPSPQSSDGQVKKS